MTQNQQTQSNTIISLENNSNNETNQASTPIAEFRKSLIVSIEEGKTVIGSSTHNNYSQKPLIQATRLVPTVISTPEKVEKFEALKNIAPVPVAIPEPTVSDFDTQVAGDYNFELAHNTALQNNVVFSQDASVFEEETGPRRINLHEVGAEIDNQSQNSFHKSKVFHRIGMVSAITATVLMLGTTALSYSNLASNQQPKTANAEFPIEIKVGISALEKNKVEYTKWIKGINNGEYLDPAGDQDTDKLTNFEEFLVGSHPLTAHTCNANISDSENLINLINPATCKAIDTNSKTEVEMYGQVVNIPELQKTAKSKK